MASIKKNKKYVWQLGVRLYGRGKTMSGAELARRLNKKKLRTSYNMPYKGKRGIYQLIRNTVIWLKNTHGLKRDANKVYKSFVLPNGKHPCESREG